MALKIVLPFLYLGFGFVVGKTRIDIKNQTAYLLTRLVIPMVIIYNIATFHGDLRCGGTVPQRQFFHFISVIHFSEIPSEPVC